MRDQQADNYDTSTIGTDDRVIDRAGLGGVGTVETVGTRAYSAPRARSFTDENEFRVRDRVQWGPIVAGTLTALATLLLLTVLGLAVGASAFEPGTDVSDWGTGAGIWGAISAIVALFLGGWVAAKTAAVDGQFAGLMNGLMAGIATVLLLIWLTTTGLSNVLGFLGNNISDITSVASDTFDVGAGDAENAADDAGASVTEAANSESTYDRVADGAWGTLIALALALGAAALGGYLGFNRREDLITGTGNS